MEEENLNELDSLILQKQRPNRTKRLLLAAVVLLLVLIGIILITRSIMQPDTQSKATIILPPEPTEKPITQKPKEPLFEEVPIKEASATQDSGLHRVIEKAKQKETAKTESPKPEVAKRSEADIIIDDTIAKKETHIKMEPQTAAAPTKPMPPKTPKKEAHAKPVPPKPKKTAAPTGSLKHGYYIQVGAFFRNPPSRKFLNAVKREDLHYTIMEGVKNGEMDGTLYAYEFKWNASKIPKLPKTFSRTYPNHEFKVIRPDNYEEFVMSYKER